MTVHDRHGFTLIELSLVLVIIGLLIGGVLAGKDLIEAAQLRRTISQIEQFNTATLTFKSKFNCLPGDCSHAVSLGFDNNGDGDGEIGSTPETVAANSGLTFHGFNSDPVTWTEMGEYWVQLGRSRLIEGSYTLELDLPNGASSMSSSPRAKSSAAFWWLSSSTIINSNSLAGDWPYGPIIGKHVFWLTNTLAIDSVGSASLSPLAALSIDSKMDDGLPETGNVLAADNYSADAGGPSQNYTGGSAGAPAGGPTCVAGDTTPHIYNATASAFGANCAGSVSACNLCALVVGASF